mmetsp:Transcript_83837/g.211438  ORF Transcript_83837/g.211438 Transcript_83837/m.211438 type:complete len:212 (+) Transcript_83837:447-1082(+)
MHWGAVLTGIGWQAHRQRWQPRTRGRGRCGGGTGLRDNWERGHWHHTHPALGGGSARQWGWLCSRLREVQGRRLQLWPAALLWRRSLPRRLQQTRRGGAMVRAAVEGGCVLDVPLHLCENALHGDTRLVEPEQVLGARLMYNSRGCYHSRRGTNTSRTPSSLWLPQYRAQGVTQRVDELQRLPKLHRRGHRSVFAAPAVSLRRKRCRRRPR